MLRSDVWTLQMKEYSAAAFFFPPFSANNEAQSGAASGTTRDTPSSTVAPGLFLKESHYKLWAGFKKGSPDVV